VLGIAGFREGLVRGAVKLAGFIITVIALAVLAEPIGKLAGWVPFVPHKVAVILTFMAVFILGSVLFAILGNILRKVVHLTPLGMLDSGMGTLFGILKAVFLGGILALLFSLMPQNGFWKKQYESSLSGSPLTRLISRSIPVITAGGINLFKHFSHEPSPPEPKKDPHAPSNII
jgi:uncharacterized membrane protein required for colicin V production